MIKTTLTLLAGVTFAVTGHPLPAGSNAGDAYVLDVRTAPDSAPARDAETSGDDVRIVNGCIADGGSKADCVCVAYVMKYEMTLGEYREAAGNLTRRASYSRAGQSDRPAVSTPTIAQTRRRDDLQRRCAAARRYFGMRAT